MSEDQTLLTIFQQNAEPVDTQSNQPVVLNTLQEVWLVTSGYLDIFVQPNQSSELIGRRRHIMRKTKDELLFVSDISRSDSPIQLIAVGTPGTTIHKMPLQSFVAPLMKEPALLRLVTKAIEQWVIAFFEGVVTHLPPKEVTSLNPTQALSLSAGVSACTTSSVLWAKHTFGQSKFLSNDSLNLSPTDGYFPVTDKTWIETMEEVTLDILDTSQWLQSESGIQLQPFHTLILRCLETNLHAEQKGQSLLFKTRIKNEQNTSETALAQLSSVITDPEFVSLSTTQSADMVLTACQFVGNAQGIQIVSPEGEPASELNKSRLDTIARMSNIRSRQVVLRGAWWEQDNGPLLAQFEENRRPVALIPTSPTTYDLIDPLDLSRTTVDAEVNTRLSPFAYIFYRPLPFEPVSLIDLFRFGLQGCKKDLFALGATGLLGGAISLMLPILIGFIFDDIIPDNDRSMLMFFLLILVVGSISVTLFEIVRGVAMVRIENRLNTSIQSAIWDRLLNLPMHFFRQYTVGDLALRANSINIIRQTISGLVITTVLGAIFSSANLVLLFFYDVQLAITGVALAVIAFLFSTLISFRSMRHQHELTELEGKISGRVLQFLSGISKLRVAGAEVYAFAAWASLFSRKKQKALVTGYLLSWQTVFSTTFPLLASVFIFGQAFALIGQEGGLTLGQFLAFNTAFTIFLIATMQMSLALIPALNIIPFYKRAQPILQTLPEIGQTKSNPGELKGEIEINHVDFRYHPNGPLVLKDVSIHITPGEFVAIVGASGSGKSTLLRLLLGFETPENGSVLYDSQNLTELDIREVRRQISTILQTSRLMSGDIYSNIVGTSGKNLDDAWDAAHRAGLDTDIKAMPMQMHTSVNEGGTTLSGGQRQRLLIARALVTHPRIIYFDEATSALDNKTQAIVRKSLEALQVTRVVIAHRLSTIQHADQIYVMDKGCIIEHGRYEELIAENGHFAELARRQLI